MSKWRAIVRQRLGHEGADTPLIDELAQHLEDRFLERRSSGASDADAEAAAVAELDNDARLREEIARAHRVARALAPLTVDEEARRRWLSGLRQDVRYATRTLRRTPGFTAAAVLTVALTTGPTTAVLGIAHWLFLRPLPATTEPHRLATVNFGVPRDGGSYSVSAVSYAHAARLAEASPSVAALTGWQRSSVSVGRDGAEPAIRPVEFVNANFFDVLGVRMIAGRAFAADEDATPGGAPVAVVSERAARVLFPDGNATGQTLRINGHVVTVIGVTPAVFPGTSIQRPVDLWMTGMTSPRIRHAAVKDWTYALDRGPFYQYFARLAPGATFEAAAVELQGAALALSTTAPEARKFSTVRPMVHAVVGVDPLAIPRLWSVVRILIAAGVLLIVLGSANLINLFVFRNARRSQETAVRRAMGASGGRLMRLHASEAVVVAVTGGGIGLALIVLGQQLFGGAINTSLGPLEIPVNWPLAGVAFGLSLLVGIAVGVAAPHRAGKNLAAALGAGARSTGRAGARLRSALAVVQLALSLTLMIGALLFASSLHHLRTSDPGFDGTNVTRASFAFDVMGYRPERSRQFLNDVTTRLQADNPGMRVAFADSMPLYGSGTGNQVFAPHLAMEQAFRANAVEVSEDFFAAMGIPIVAGRAFTADEARLRGIEPAVLVNETLARQLYGTTDVVGRVVTFRASASAPQRDIRIVGVTTDTRWQNLTRPAPPMVFRPAGNLAPFNNVLIVRSPSGSTDAVRRIRSVAAALDPSLPVVNDGPIETLVDLRLSEERLFAWVVTALAVIGFVLAAVGLQGLVSQTVVERTREFGVRLALGATRAQIVRLVLRSSWRMMLIGTPAGLAMAYALGRAVSSRLHGVTAADPLVFTVGVTALMAVAIAASLVPARAASKANPIDILRNDG